MGITHFDDAPSAEFEVGHIRGRWTNLGGAAGSAGVGVRRIQVPDGGWSTPAHDHGKEEEIFYVLAGRGLIWHAGRTAEIGPGDAIVFRPRRGGHTLHSLDSLDVLAFGPREYDESPYFPRLGMMLLEHGLVEVMPRVLDHAPAQFVKEAKLGPPELPDPAGARPPTITNVSDVQADPFGQGERIRCLRRNLGIAIGSRDTGLKYIEVPPGKQATPLHCHSEEEEIFVVLEGDGQIQLGEDLTAVRPGTVVCRPPATGIAHAFHAGDAGLTFLAYGTRRPGELCYYPHSNKISFRGIGVIGRLERLEYWDGEQ